MQTSKVQREVTVLIKNAQIGCFEGIWLVQKVPTLSLFFRIVVLNTNTQTLSLFLGKCYLQNRFKLLTHTHANTHIHTHLHAHTNRPFWSWNEMLGQSGAFLCVRFLWVPWGRRFQILFVGPLFFFLQARRGRKTKPTNEIQIQCWVIGIADKIKWNFYRQIKENKYLIKILRRRHDVARIRSKPNLWF